ncbi:MAG: hypothetical protein OEW62_01820 [Candidatus Bathyarchaeota archaeon]|nr:hypothetical protein [Candidatus Bathyarchaeota archaeon]MDH5595184.1 hypothetical protein [Candidatus Bathyarchaeota archaeon]
MKNPKILVTLLIPILFISMGAYSYAHFTDTLVKKYRLHVNCFTVEIKSYKAVSRYDDDLITKYPPDDVLKAMGGTTTISLSTNQAFPGWYVWVGLLIQNQGGYTAQVNAPIYDINDPAGIGVHTEEYCYGPFTHGEFVAADQTVWGGIRWKDLEESGPPPGGSPPPMVLEPYGKAYQNKMVMWIYIQLLDLNGPPEDFKITLEITIDVTLAESVYGVAQDTNEEIGSDWVGDQPP